jgi:hypothetical protein
LIVTESLRNREQFELKTQTLHIADIAAAQHVQPITHRTTSASSLATLIVASWVRGGGVKPMTLAKGLEGRSGPALPNAGARAKKGAPR